MPEAFFVRWFARIYGVLLYAWPREFRLAYGNEVRQVFRDRCTHVARAGDRAKILSFAMAVAADWATTALRERFEPLRSALASARKSPVRGFVAEWSMTILLYLFATTTLVQAYVIPTGSMESNLRVGDHMLVDKLTYANPGAVGAVVCRGGVSGRFRPDCWIPKPHRSLGYRRGYDCGASCSSLEIRILHELVWRTKRPWN